MKGVEKKNQPTTLYMKKTKLMGRGDILSTNNKLAAAKTK